MHSGCILEAEKPVFLVSGGWVFFGSTAEVLHVVHDGWELFQDELHPNTSGEIHQGVETQPFWVPKRLPQMAWVEKRGYIFGEDSIE